MDGWCSGTAIMHLTSTSRTARVRDLGAVILPAYQTTEIGLSGALPNTGMGPVLWSMFRGPADDCPHPHFHRQYNDRRGLCRPGGHGCITVSPKRNRWYFHNEDAVSSAAQREHWLCRCRLLRDACLESSRHHTATGELAPTERDTVVFSVVAPASRPWASSGCRGSCPARTDGNGPDAGQPYHESTDGTRWS